MFFHQFYITLQAITVTITSKPPTQYHNDKNNRHSVDLFGNLLVWHVHLWVIFANSQRAATTLYPYGQSGALGAVFWAVLFARTGLFL